MTLTYDSMIKINRVPPLIIHNLHVKSERDWAQTIVCIVSTRSYTQSAKDDLDLWPHDPKSIGFLLSSSTTYMFLSLGRGAVGEGLQNNWINLFDMREKYALSVQILSRYPGIFFERREKANNQVEFSTCSCPCWKSAKTKFASPPQPHPFPDSKTNGRPLLYMFSYKPSNLSGN